MNVVPGLDGVADITIILDPVARGGDIEGKAHAFALARAWCP
jgi:hypothetical protein